MVAAVVVAAVVAVAAAAAQSSPLLLSSSFSFSLVLLVGIVLPPFVMNVPVDEALHQLLSYGVK